MYKTADFIHALHRANSLSFDYTILFIAYNRDEATKKTTPIAS